MKGWKQVKTNAEILAPVGNFSMLEAAVHNGADAVYVGMPGFNARGRSPQLSDDELGKIIETAHLYGVKVYIALNVLIFENEFKELHEKLSSLMNLHPDALIVQDAGLAVFLNKYFPKIRLHASTQMTTTSEYDIRFYKDINFKRFTLSRELFVDEIAHIKNQTELELESFVHGALCISYSGQCMTSSGLGGRSANRGECAQSCRHPYDLMVDGEVTATDGSFLVSPKDLDGFAFKNRLVETGIHALKIEGRLKSPEYVAATCRKYSGLDEEIETRFSFSRDGFSGWLAGFDSKTLINEKINSHTGIHAGIVSGSGMEFVSVRPVPEIEFKKGQGVLFSGKEMSGGYLYNVKKHNDNFQLYLDRNFECENVELGSDVYISSDPEFQKNISKTFTNRESRKKIPISMYFRAEPGSPSSLILVDDSNRSVEVFSSEPVQIADKHPVKRDMIVEELSSLSGTVYAAAELKLEIPDENIFIPNKQLKLLRQTASAEMDALRIRRDAVEVPAHYSEQEMQILAGHRSNRDSKILSELPEKNRNLRMNILIRNADDAILISNLKDKNCIRNIYLDFEYGRDYDQAFEVLRKNNFHIGIALNRVFKPGEEKQIESLLSRKPDALLVRNAGTLQYLIEKGYSEKFELIGDFSLNITNSIAADFYLSRGLGKIASSFDLYSDNGSEVNIHRFKSFLKNSNPDKVEAIVSYYLPSFYMEYCLYAHHLGNGGDYKTCGYPCKRHELSLKDRKGISHPVTTDRNCRNTMFHGQNKNIFRSVPELIVMGVREFRIEGLKEADVLMDSIDRMMDLFSQSESRATPNS